MFKKILIANRGEIALRVICACRELGIKTVAVYSEADEHSLHVRFADEDVCIGPARSADSYLNVPAIISAAEITGADAIHPGYGFLSESAYLAEVCEACHIKFIGPSPNVIRLMGDKARARRAMKKAGVPVLPGSDGPVDSEEQAAQDRQRSRLSRSSSRRSLAAADAACASIRAPASWRKALKTAQREAEAAFGVGDVYLEKYVERRATSSFRCWAIITGTSCTSASASARSSGGTRSSSKKAPSLALTEKQRRKLGARSSTPRAPCSTPTPARSSSCSTTGGNFFFLEANTRLQVEHPVTEFVTGVDIVKEQIRIAAGERLSVKQGDIEFNGHSIECRVNAEDPETFVPCPGVIHAFSVPGGPGVRVDSYAHSECTVSPYYDSLIAKIITHGRDRQEAIARMRRTLEMTVIDGIKTSIPLHLKILADPDFIAGRSSTAFMERFMIEEAGSAGSPNRLSASPVRIIGRRPLPRLYAILDLEALAARGAGARRLPARLARGCSSSGQSRSRAAALLALARDSARRAARGRPLILNDRADLARLSGADGVHVGQDDLPPDDARQIVGPDAIVGLSTHTRRADRRRRSDDRRTTSPSARFRTATKDTGYTARGLDLVTDAPRRPGRPVVAIGGITLDTRAEVLDAGATPSP